MSNTYLFSVRNRLPVMQFLAARSVGEQTCSTSMGAKGQGCKPNNSTKQVLPSPSLNRSYSGAFPRQLSILALKCKCQVHVKQPVNVGQHGKRWLRMLRVDNVHGDGN
jgi:hypothetical protein